MTPEARKKIIEKKNPDCIVKIRANGSISLKKVKFGKTRTEQHHKEACIIQNVINRFDKKGILTTANKMDLDGDGVVDMTGIDYQEYMNQVARANQNFAQQPSTIRNRFDNSPKKYLDFLADETRNEEAYELGLKVRPPAPTPEPEPEPAPPPPAE